MPQIPEETFERRNELIEDAKKEVGELVKELRDLEESGTVSVKKDKKARFDAILEEIEDQLEALEDFGDPDEDRP
jgi:hypothetical protein